MAKRVFDLLLAVLLLPVVVPLVGIIALAVKLDSPGPAFFNQRRAGRDGKPFLMFKLRTMVPDAERRQPYPSREELTGFVFQREDDPRITRLGRILRKTSLDELPQLFNIIRGEMSFVGPRPEVLPIVALYTEEERKRLTVPPGITGLAQVSGRSDLSTGEIIVLDNEYVVRRNMALDLWLLWRTVAVVLLRQGAR